MASDTSIVQHTLRLGNLLPSSRTTVPISVLLVGAVHEAKTNWKNEPAKFRFYITLDNEPDQRKSSTKFVTLEGLCYNNEYQHFMYRGVCFRMNSTIE